MAGRGRRPEQVHRELDLLGPGRVDEVRTGLEQIGTTVFDQAWNLPPVKLGRFLVATVVPGAYGRDIRRRHDKAQRLSDENTLRVLASVALWQRNKEGPTCPDEAAVVLKAFCQQSDVRLGDALDPHAAAVARVLLQQKAGPASPELISGQAS